MERAGEAHLSFSQLQAIASPTRLRLLQALVPRRATLSELSNLTGVAKATIHSSMELLAREGFLRRLESDEVWVYYELTVLGRAVANMKPLRLIVFYATASLVATAGMGMIMLDVLRSDELSWNIPPIGVPPEPEPLISLDATALGAALVVIGIGGLLSVWLHARI
ncbi:MAG: winged helix-turn-helix domain-containing protein, partial [Candidatus Thermoplasmatota archaeon]